MCDTQWFITLEILVLDCSLRIVWILIWHRKVESYKVARN